MRVCAWKTKKLYFNSKQPARRVESQYERKKAQTHSEINTMKAIETQAKATRVTREA